MNCCNKNINKESLNCPLCGQEGTAVKALTLMSLLKTELLKLVSESKTYRYCKTRNCHIAYFSSEEVFKVDDLKVKATHKDDGLDVPVCYCFDYSRERILSDLKANGNTDALNEIKAKMKDPGCFCEKSNPQGSCCLGNVSSWIKEAENLID